MKFNINSGDIFVHAYTSLTSGVYAWKKKSIIFESVRYKVYKLDTQSFYFVINNLSFK